MYRSYCKYCSWVETGTQLLLINYMYKKCMNNVIYMFPYRETKLASGCHIWISLSPLHQHRSVVYLTTQNKDTCIVYSHCKLHLIFILFFVFINLLPYLGLHNAHPLLALKISRKKLVRVYNAHGLLKKIVVGNVRIKYQLYIFFSPSIIKT